MPRKNPHVVSGHTGLVTVDLDSFGPGDQRFDEIAKINRLPLFEGSDEAPKAAGLEAHPADKHGGQ